MNTIQNTNNKQILVIAGATAVGKTEYAIKFANKFNGEIVSCDSMQLYKYMDIGSAKPTPRELAQAKHYLVNEIDPREKFSVAKYQKLAKQYINEIFAKGKMPIIAGGTGLYLNSLLYDMDFAESKANFQIREKYENFAQIYGKQALHDLLAEKDASLAEKIHPNNVRKVIRALETLETSGKSIDGFADKLTPTGDYDAVSICLNRERKELYARINKRVDLLIEAGLIDEIKSLMAKGLTSDDISMKGIGYKEIINYLNGAYDMDTAIELVKRNTRRYAKRQITWFKRYDDMKWFDISDNPFKNSETYIEEISIWIQKHLQQTK